MTFVAAWFVLPIVLAACALGCGLLVEVATGRALPRGALLPVGFAAVIVLAAYPALTATTAELAPPLVVTAAALGIGLAVVLRSRAARVDPWAALVAVAAYAAYAAPVALTGRATFAGYIKLDDTATYLAMIDRVATDGYDVSGLAPSTYEATLSTSLAYGYPIGSFAPLAAAQRLLAIDAAWLWQPYLAFLGALVALGLYAVAAPLVPVRPLRAAIAFIAAQPAILYGFSLWGGIKELSAAFLVATLAACVPPLLERAASVRDALPLAVVAAAIAGVLSVAGAAWLLLLVPALVLVVVYRGAAFGGLACGVFAVATAALALPAFVAATEWLPRAGGFASDDELANLLEPLRWLQIGGIWPVGDFRRAPSDLAVTNVLLALVFVAAVAAIAWAIRMRTWALALYGAGAVAAAAAFYVVGSPWIQAKALATAAPAVLLLALVAAASLVAAGRRIEGAVLGALIAGGVAWSNALAYREVWLAPDARLRELEEIGDRETLGAPALLTEFEPYGARHFLRRLDAEATSELRRRVIPLRTGAPLEPQAYADLDEFQLEAVLVYRTLVLRRSPTASRPPSSYALVARGEWYDVWQRREPPTPLILEHLPLGSADDPGGVPDCRDVLRLGARPDVRSLAAATTPAASAVATVEGGRTNVTIAVPVRRRYRIWVEGSFVGRLEARVDGRRVGASSHQLQWPGHYVSLGATSIGPGRHRITVVYRESGWRPASRGDAPFSAGRVVVAADEERRIITVPPEAARSLCGRKLDWVEALG